MKGEFDRTIMVYIDAYKDRIPEGRFHAASHQGEQPFRGINQLILGINEFLDHNKFPQSFFELRKFRNADDPYDPYDFSLTKNQGKLATFSIRILFRQNASWQGSVTWVEGSRSEYFRSVLELMALMDDALTEP